MTVKLEVDIKWSKTHTPQFSKPCPTKLLRSRVNSVDFEDSSLVGLDAMFTDKQFPLFWTSLQPYHSADRGSKLL
jgi:hypothetical protein